MEIVEWKLLYFMGVVLGIYRDNGKIEWCCKQLKISRGPIEMRNTD